MINKLFPEIQDLVKKAQNGFNQIPENRKEKLAHLAATIKEAPSPKALTFICTHNSRRSHLSQIWAQVAAFIYQVPDIETYSGGTEATAFNPRAVNALKNVGFLIKNNLAKNPVYEVMFSEEKAPIACYSKTYHDKRNPQNGFVAVMTCTEADENCPVVLGALKRVSLPYNDPKAFDGTPQEAEKYAERNFEIAREMLYTFSLLKL